MDPLSITAASVSLAGAVANTTVAIAGFTRTMRSARGDLIATSRHLGELTSTLNLLRDENTDQLPKELRDQLRFILKDCESILADVDAALKKYSTGAAVPARWAVSGKREVEGLNKQLENHLRTLGIAVEAATMALTQAIREDTGTIRIDAKRILEEIANLRADLQTGTAEPDNNSGVGGRDYMINRYLDSLTSYAETAVDGASVYRLDPGPPGVPPQPSGHSRVLDRKLSKPFWLRGKPQDTIHEEPLLDSPTPSSSTRDDRPGPLFVRAIAGTAHGRNKIVTLSPDGLFVTIQDCPVYREGIRARLLGCWEVSVYDAKRGKLAYRHDCKDLAAESMVFSPNSEFLAIASPAGVKIFHTRRWTVTWEIPKPEQYIWPCQVAVQMDNSHVAVCTSFSVLIYTLSATRRPLQAAKVTLTIPQGFQHGKKQFSPL
ncbi:hypothetical protein OQA88_10874 [Cercophora sp. LCS_1]